MNAQSERNEKLANDLKEFIMKNRLNIDVRIYFNNKCYDWIVYLKEPNIIEDIKGSSFFEYANDETVSMSFEGDLYDIINYGELPSILEGFESVFEKHGFYYELGNAWNLSAYQI